MNLAPKRILVATDFSTFSLAAAEAAVDLAVRYRARLTLVHVVPLSTYVEYTSGHEGLRMTSAELEAAVQASARKLIAAEVERLQKVAAVEISSEPLRGPPAVEICRFAAENQFDLIVVGSHGRSGAARFLMGSVAEGVVRHATSSVLVIRTAAR